MMTALGIIALAGVCLLLFGMAWPTTGGGSQASGYLAEGVTTIRWGSKQLLQKAGTSSAGGGGTSLFNIVVVTRANERALVENIKLPNGDGPTITRVQIVDGVMWELTLRDDTRWVDISVPKVGTYVTIVDMAGLIDAVGEVYVACVAESGGEASPKTPFERSITVEHLTLIEGGGVLSGGVAQG